MTGSESSLRFGAAGGRRSEDLPALRVGHCGVACTTNPVGVKGAGESGVAGALPSAVNAVLDAIEKTKFAVERMDNIGYSYARTLREWRINFMRNTPTILKLGFDDIFIRKWEYYFCYCEAGFMTQYLGDYQIVISHPKYLTPCKSSATKAAQ